MIYICIPARNEEDTIGLLLWKVRKVMAEFGRDYRILVLDDGSTDGTARVLERYESFLPLTVLSSPAPVGHGGAMDRLFREVVRQAEYPKRDAVVALQGDFSEHPENIVPLVKTLEGGADIVAARPPESDSADAPRGVRFVRWAGRWLLGGALREAPVSDPYTGLRAYRVIVLKKALRERGEAPLMGEGHWAGNLELLGAVAPHARRIEETELAHPGSFRTRPSRFRPLPALRSFLRLRGKVRWNVSPS